MIRESISSFITPSPHLPEASRDLVFWIFNQIGTIVELPPKNFDTVTALGGSGPAFCALFLEGMADGGVAMGMTRADAVTMAANVMRGAAGMVLAGERPDILKEKVSSPGGCTIGGLMVLEEGAVRGKIARAVRESTTIASQLGTGVQNVNGTRH